MSINQKHILQSRKKTGRKKKSFPHWSNVEGNQSHWDGGVSGELYVILEFDTTLEMQFQACHVHYFLFQLFKHKYCCLMIINPKYDFKCFFAKRVNKRCCHHMKDADRSRPERFLLMVVIFFTAGFAHMQAKLHWIKNARPERRKYVTEITSQWCVIFLKRKVQLLSAVM